MQNKTTDNTSVCRAGSDVKQAATQSKITTTELLCRALGWQGGTIHQVAAETGLSTKQILDGDELRYSNMEGTGNGWVAWRTCDAGYRQSVLYPKRKGDAGFWYGVARAIECEIKGHI